jgi:hypothetical protein
MTLVGKLASETKFEDNTADILRFAALRPMLTSAPAQGLIFSYWSIQLNSSIG